MQGFSPRCNICSPLHAAAAGITLGRPTLVVPRSRAKSRGTQPPESHNALQELFQDNRVTKEVRIEQLECCDATAETQGAGTARI